MKLNYAYLSLALLAPAWCLGQPDGIRRKLDWWVANSNVRRRENDRPAAWPTSVGTSGITATIKHLLRLPFGSIR